MFNEKELLEQTVAQDTELKNYIVDYVGEKLTPEDENITVEMVIGVLADDFPELVLAMAEENFIRGYSQAMSDVIHENTGPKNDDE